MRYVNLRFTYLLTYLQYTAVRSFDRQIVINLKSSFTKLRLDVLIAR